MALDGGFLHLTVQQLKEAESAFVDKIYQPSKDELILLLRKKGFSKKLYVNVNPASPRIQFTSSSYENPASPPMFCMLLRKHLGAAKLTEISQPSLERVVFLEFSSVNEMGDRQSIKIAVELISGRPNIILLGPMGRIIDAVHRSDLEKSTRIIQPGALYTIPKSQNKLSVLDTQISVLCDNIIAKAGIPLSKAVLSVLDGVSPLVAREIAFLSADDIDTPADLTDKSRLSDALNMIKSSLTSGAGLCTVCSPTGAVFDFSYIPIKQYSQNYTLKHFDSCSDILDEYYSQKQGLRISEQKAKDIIKLLKTTKERIIRKTELRKKDLKKCENREQLRLYGELLKANLHLVQSGAPFVDVENYYDENLAKIRIPLNPSLSPALNAAKFFKDYKKTYSAEQTLSTLIEQDEKELIYIESVLENISRANTASELDEIRQELIQAGYLKTTASAKQKQKKVSAPLEFTSPTGFKVYVGKNNLQNDYLTLKFANKTDYWFHTKNIPGSHVIVITNGSDIDDNTILFAAKLAKEHSKASLSTKVAVDYTLIKNVKKPSGAKPGMVIYLTNKTILID